MDWTWRELNWCHSVNQYLNFSRVWIWEQPTKKILWVLSKIWNEGKNSYYFSWKQDLLCSSRGSGYLISKIKYLKQQQRLSRANAAEIEYCADSEDQEVTPEISSSCSEDLDFLKIAVVNKDNVDAIKMKLSATSDYRRQLIRGNHGIDLLENFPYFFHNPKLVTQQLNFIIF